MRNILNQFSVMCPILYNKTLITIVKLFVCNIYWDFPSPGHSLSLMIKTIPQYLCGVMVSVAGHKTSDSDNASVGLHPASICLKGLSSFFSSFRKLLPWYVNQKMCWKGHKTSFQSFIHLHYQTCFNNTLLDRINILVSAYYINLVLS